MAASVLIPVLTVAGGSPSTESLAAHTSCPTDYSGATFPCSTSTSSPSTVPHSQLSLEAHYSGGKLSVKACGFTSAAKGHTAQLYVDGSPISAAQGGSATIDGSGCAVFTASVCLGQGNHGLAVEDQTPVSGGTAEVTGSVSVSPAKACRNATVAASGQPASGQAASGFSSGGAEANLAGGAGSGAVGHHAPLAFTGSYLGRAVVVGAVLVLAGYLLVRRSREQNRRRRYGYTRLR